MPEQKPPTKPTTGDGDIEAAWADAMNDLETVYQGIMGKQPKKAQPKPTQGE